MRQKILYRITPLENLERILDEGIKGNNNRIHLTDKPLHWMLKIADHYPNVDKYTHFIKKGIINDDDHCSYVESVPVHIGYNGDIIHPAKITAYYIIDRSVALIDSRCRRKYFDGVKFYYFLASLSRQVFEGCIKMVRYVSTLVFSLGSKNINLDIPKFRAAARHVGVPEWIINYTPKIDLPERDVEPFIEKLDAALRGDLSHSDKTAIEIASILEGRFLVDKSLMDPTIATVLELFDYPAQLQPDPKPIRELANQMASGEEVSLVAEALLQRIGYTDAPEYKQIHDHNKRNMNNYQIEYQRVKEIVDGLYDDYHNTMNRLLKDGDPYDVLIAYTVHATTKFDSTDENLFPLFGMLALQMKLEELNRTGVDLDPNAYPSPVDFAIGAALLEDSYYEIQFGLGIVLGLITAHPKQIF